MTTGSGAVTAAVIRVGSHKKYTMKTFATTKLRSSPGMLLRRAAIPSSAHTHQRGQFAAVRQILRNPRLQTQLTIGAPDDIYEQEADRVADEVMRMPEPQVQRAPT